MILLTKYRIETIKSFVLNFGLQHPAAHGVLSLILEMLLLNNFKKKIFNSFIGTNLLKTMILLIKNIIEYIKSFVLVQVQKKNEISIS